MYALEGREKKGLSVRARLPAQLCCHTYLYQAGSPQGTRLPKAVLAVFAREATSSDIFLQLTLLGAQQYARGDVQRPWTRRTRAVATGEAEAGPMAGAWQCRPWSSEEREEVAPPRQSSQSLARPRRVSSACSALKVACRAATGRAQ